MRVAVCVDESEPSEKALQEAVSFAEQADAELVLLHGVKETVTADGGDQLVRESTQDAVERGRQITQEMKDQAVGLTETALDIETAVLQGDYAVEAITEYVSGNGVEHVFIGHRALSQKHEELVGSFAKDMISQTPVPVTVVTDN